MKNPRKPNPLKRRRNPAFDLLNSPGAKTLAQDIQIFSLIEILGRDEALRLLNIACAQKQLMEDQQPVPLTERIQ